MYPHMRRTLSILAALTILISSYAQEKPQFPIYSDFSLPSPGKSTRLSRSELEPTEAFLDQYPDGIPVASNEQLHQLCKYLKDNPDGRKEWNSWANLTARTVSSWSIKSMGGFGASRYIYATSNLRQLSWVYIFTGNQLVGEFIRANLAKMVSLPITFWLHSELRGYDEEHPRGGLETAALNITLAYAIPAVKKDMSEDEYNSIMEAWRERAHIPSLNWLESVNSKVKFPHDSI